MLDREDEARAYLVKPARQDLRSRASFVAKMDSSLMPG